MSFTVALNSTTILINIVGTKATLDSFIFSFLLSVLIVIVIVL